MSWKENINQKSKYPVGRTLLQRVRTPTIWTTIKLLPDVIAYYSCKRMDPKFVSITIHIPLGPYNVTCELLSLRKYTVTIIMARQIVKVTFLECLSCY